MPIVHIDAIPDKRGRTARRLLFICRDCPYIGHVAVRKNLYGQVCQECGSRRWVSIEGDIRMIQVPPKEPND
jgi:hypothetical protein